MKKVTSSSATCPPASTSSWSTRKPSPNEPVPSSAPKRSKSPPATKPPQPSPSPPYPTRSKNSRGISHGSIDSAALTTPTAVGGIQFLFRGRDYRKDFSRVPNLNPAHRSGRIVQVLSINQPQIDIQIPQTKVGEYFKPDLFINNSE